MRPRKSPSSIPLVDGAHILEHKDPIHGLLRIEGVTEETATNKRRLIPKASVVAQIGINCWPEIAIMNIHQVSYSIGGGAFLTPRMFGLPGLPFGVYGGPRRGNLKVFRNISFLNEGQFIMTFENVKDLQGVRQLLRPSSGTKTFVPPVGFDLGSDRVSGNCNLTKLIAQTRLPRPARESATMR